MGKWLISVLPLDLVLDNLNKISILFIRILVEKSIMKQMDSNKLDS